MLESDGACTGLNGHSARKSAVLVLVCCYKARGDREQDLRRYKTPESHTKKWYYKRSGYGCLRNKCLKGEQWSSDLAVSCTLAKHCDIRSENTRFKALLSPLTRIDIDVADSSVLSVMFLRSLCIFSGCPIINIHSCHQDWKLSWVVPMEYCPRTGSHYSKLLTYLCHDCSSFSNISGLDLGGKCLTSIQIRHVVRLFEF